jgi:hypothetical protein
LKYLRATLGALFVALLACGCDDLEQRRVTWSPDGSKAAVVAADGLHLCDSTGKLSKLLVKDVKTVAWLPDSQHAVIATVDSTDQWNVVQSLLSDADKQKVEAAAARFRGDILSGAWAADKMDEHKKRFPEDFYFKDEATLLLRDRGIDSLKENLGDKLQDFMSKSVRTTALTLRSLSDTGSNVEQTLYSGTKLTGEIRVSPDGRLAAVTEELGDWANGAFRLSVISLDGKQHVVLTDYATQFPDWDPESKHLIYIMVNDAQEAKLSSSVGELVRTEVVDMQGKLIEKFAHDTIALVPFCMFDRIRCLRDGRILISAPEVELPALVHDLGVEQQIYMLDPKYGSALIRLTAHGEANDTDRNVTYFEPNASGTNILFPNTNGAAYLLNVASGGIQKVSHDTFADARVLPQWRSNTDVCFSDETKAGKRAELYLWTAGSKDKPVSISDHWPVEAVRGFLEAPPSKK